MSDFSDRPLIAGSLVGLRSFGVDAYGRLTGVNYRRVFTPEVNVARCAGDSRKGGFIIGPMHLAGLSCGCPMCRPTVETAKTAPDHRVAQLDCTCGFYAYFDREANPYHKNGNVLGLVEGFGNVTVGSRGFRAEKAKLVALIDETPTPLTLVKRHTWQFWLSFAGALSIIFWAVLDLRDTRWGLGSTELGLALILLTVLIAFRNKAFLAKSNPGKSNPGKSARLSAEIRRNYADVPVYPSLTAALAEHPLTPPEKPSPESDPEFWTRSVS